MPNKTPHIKLIAFKNDDVPANAPQYSMKKYKVDEDIHIKAGEYDVDVFENVFFLLTCKVGVCNVHHLYYLTY